LINHKLNSILIFISRSDLLDTEASGGISIGYVDISFIFDEKIPNENEDYDDNDKYHEFILLDIFTPGSFFAWQCWGGVIIIISVHYYTFIKDKKFL